MRTAGFRSNRLYDAVACGAVVVSDRVLGLDGAFGDAVVTYEDADELAPLLDRLLSNEADRRRRSEEGRRRVAEAGTFDQRADQLLKLVEEAYSHRNR
jgi:spore maturation protein CgeB